MEKTTEEMCNDLDKVNLAEKAPITNKAFESLFGRKLRINETDRIMQPVNEVLQRLHDKHS